MRYQKGTIELGDKDYKLLQIVASTSKITQPQLFEISTIKKIEPKRGLFNKRIQRLVKHGLLKTEDYSFFGSRRLYSITERGIWGLAEGGIHPLSVYVEGDDEVDHQTIHTLQLNRAHIALLKVDAGLQWTPSKDICVMNRSGYQSYAKTYDAAVRMMVDYRFYDIGIEYERTLKASKKYDELLALLDSETKLDLILYLFSNDKIGSALSWIFRNCKKAVVVTDLEEFVRTPLDSSSTQRYLTTTLRATLKQVETQRSGAVGRDSSAPQSTTAW